MEAKEKPKKPKSVNGKLTCEICHQEINLDSEFCQFVFYKKAHQIEKINFFHKNCFKDKFFVAPQIQDLSKKADLMLNLAMKQLNTDSSRFIN